MTGDTAPDGSERDAIAKHYQIAGKSDTLKNDAEPKKDPDAAG